jgi:hypothetical protein
VEVVKDEELEEALRQVSREAEEGDGELHGCGRLLRVQGKGLG